MKKITNKKQVLKLDKYCEKVINSILDIIIMLDENYGEDRDIDKELGGYVLILETKEDVEKTKSVILNGIIPEYIDIIECSEGVNWTSSLFLLSSDYAIVVVSTEELSKLLIE
ncbi:hypothetical protein [Clostridium tertium]|uniref:hypothetical protein n=1 Tax=Clostridium tertium TaxID=1559 RepID=UPI002A827DAD|nr:hypothetical protein [Clostridium tertium]MDY4606017.1 hypothetical protein [Clostridium tertium]